MPFTPAHPAIVLPFLRSRYVSATALVIGSMAPDFEYFFRMSSVNDQHGHSLWGMFYFDLPVTLLLSFFFHRVVKVNLINNLPPFFQRRLGELKRLDFDSYLRENWLVFLISALVGAASHILWDSFTHPFTYFTENIAIYKQVVVPFGRVKYPLYYALQYASTYIGLVSVVVFVLFSKPANDVEVVKPVVTYWLLIIITTMVVLFLRFVWLPETMTFHNVVVSSITALCVALLVAGFFRYTQWFADKN